MKLKPKETEKSEPAAGPPPAPEGPANVAVPDIKLVAIARVQDTDEWHSVIQFVRHDGATAYMAIPSGDACKQAALATALRNLGARGCNHFTFPDKIEKLTIATCRADGIIIIRGGWDQKAESFALPDHLVVNTGTAANAKFICLNYSNKKDYQLVVKDGSPGVAQLNIACAGSVESWKKKVARPALRSSYMMSSICAAFGAPLLKLIGASPFTIVVTGETTSGKTTVTGVGASVLGFGKAEDLPTWNITAAGLEERAEIHFDMLLPIDDLNSAPGSEKDKFELVNGVAYRITGGSKRNTLTAAKSGMTGRPPVVGPIRTIIFTSAEDSMADVAVAAKRQMPGGFYTRLVEIPVPLAKRGGVFDLVKFFGSRKNRVKAARKWSKDIAQACEHNHGHVFRDYLAAIMADPQRAVQVVKTASAKFMAIAGINRKKAQQWRRAEFFAFKYAAGILAIELGLLPWTEGELQDAIVKSLALSWRTLPRSPNLLGSGLERLRDFLGRADMIVPAANVTDITTIDGWWGISGANKTYFVFGDRFRRLFISLEQRRQVEKVLEKAGVLIISQSGDPTKQPINPATGKKGPRCYELKVPAAGSLRSLLSASALGRKSQLRPTGTAPSPSHTGTKGKARPS